MSAALNGQTMIAESYITEIEAYRANGSNDEWFFAKITDHLLEDHSPQEAFDAVGEIAQFALDEEEASLFYDHIQFLIRLARTANTTECPKSFYEISKRLRAKASMFGEAELSAVKELYSWFRLPFNK